MSWMGTGFKSQDDINKEAPERRDKGPRRVWIPPQETQRFMFLDTDPQAFWEHQFKLNGNWQNWEPCVFKSKLPGHERGCPICRAKEANGDLPISWPRYTGFFTAMQMTPWITDDGTEFNYRRMIYACLSGTKENPGTYRELEKLAQKYGRLTGLIFDIERRQKKEESCGSRFELIEKIEPKEIEAYGRKLVSELMERENKKRDEGKKLTLDKMLKYNPWEPFDFEEVIKPRSYEELERLFPVVPGDKKKKGKRDDDDDDNKSSKSKSGGHDREDDDDGDDIPY